MKYHLLILFSVGLCTYALFQCSLTIHVLGQKVDRDLPRWPSESHDMGNNDVDSNHLSLQLPVASFFSDKVKKGGRTLLPPPLQQLPVVVEIGVNKSPISPPKNTAILSFEPLLGRYAQVLSSNKQDTKRKNQPLGFRPSVNGIILPMGVLDHDGYDTFRVSGHDGCSTFGNPVATTTQSVPINCTRTLETRMIPTVTLNTVIEQYLNGRTVEFLYLDGEGQDMQIMRGASRVMDKLPQVLLEIHMMHDHEHLYEGELSCQQVVDRMKEWGYELGRLTETGKLYLQRQDYSGKQNGAYMLYSGGEWSCKHRPEDAHTYDAYFVRRGHRRF